MPRKSARSIVCACGSPSRPGQRTCKACHAAYVREWRKSHPLTEAQRFKGIARAYAAVYLRRGKIIKGPCECCGGVESEMHHDDYHAPLAVRWLCRKCHLAWHDKHGGMVLDFTPRRRNVKHSPNILAADMLRVKLGGEGHE